MTTQTGLLERTCARCGFEAREPLPWRYDLEVVCAACFGKPWLQPEPSLAHIERVRSAGARAERTARSVHRRHNQ